ncbi:MAG: galactokinase [Treponema sp.]|jgi:galactokinase|nr:galactokinase [Treponema sp.]
MNSTTVLACLESAKAAELFTLLYGADEVESERRRYISLVDGMLRTEPETRADVRIFTAAGRTELAGNHTDHNRGKVLAASIQLDAVAAAAPRKDKRVFFRSVGHPDVLVDLADSSGALDLGIHPEESGNTESLIRGIAMGFAKRGVAIGGFTANAASTVLTGSGLSSSAAIEVLFGKIFDTLYGQGNRSALDLAQIGQEAENTYFGKPCGLMDQTACASGGVVAIDFADSSAPTIKSVNFDPTSCGYALCVVNTRGSHADLTPDYAAIPEEMKAVARLFGKTVLRELDKAAVLARAPEVRRDLGDRALLRTLHFFAENRRVEVMGRIIEDLASVTVPVVSRCLMGNFLDLVRESGDSSWELLQNCYSPPNPREQGVPVALALTRQFLSDRCHEGACRVHGGGFAGTIQAYIPLDRFDAYKAALEAVFGEGAVTRLRIRSIGAAELCFDKASYT